MSMRLTPPARGCARSRTVLTRACGRSHPATAAGSAVMSSMLSTWPTTRQRSGRSGIATLPSVGFPRCGNSRETCGATACRAWRWPICARRPGCLVWGSPCRRQVGRDGSPTSGSERRLRRRVGLGFWRPVQTGEMVSCSACSSRIRRFFLRARSGDRGSWRSRRCRRQGCVPDRDWAGQY